MMGDCGWRSRYPSPMWIHRIMHLSYTSEKPYMIFGCKGGEMVRTESMKEKFKLVKNLHGYAISSICNPVVKVTMQILAGKVMRNYRANEVLAPVVTLAQQCME